MTDYEKAIAYSLFEIARDGRLLTFDPLNNLYNVSIFDDEDERNEHSIECRYTPLFIRQIGQEQRSDILQAELDYMGKFGKSCDCENLVFSFGQRE